MHHAIKTTVTEHHSEKKKTVFWLITPIASPVVNITWELLRPYNIRARLGSAKVQAIMAVSQVHYLVRRLHAPTRKHHLRIKRMPQCVGVVVIFNFFNVSKVEFVIKNQNRRSWKVSSQKKTKKRGVARARSNQTMHPKGWRNLLKVSLLLQNLSSKYTHRGPTWLREMWRASNSAWPVLEWARNGMSVENRSCDISEGCC